MTHQDDASAMAWKIWKAISEGEGLPLTLQSADLLQLTETESLALKRLAARHGRTVSYDQETKTLTVR